MARRLSHWGCLFSELLIEWRKAIVGLRPSFSAHVRWGEHPNFLHAALDKSPCAPFFKERRMRFLEPIGLNRKFGAMGHPSRDEGLARDDRGAWIRKRVLTQTL